MDILKHYRTCNLCEAMCGVEVEVENGNIKSIKGDKKDPFSRGHICPKAVGLKDIYEDENRLKTPIKRTEDGWVSISWEAAFDEVAENLKTIQQKYGQDAIGVYLGNPNVHNLGSMLFGANFYRILNTKNRFSATSADQLPHHVASWAMLGHLNLLPVPDIDRTHHMLIMGGNPMVSNGSIMTAPDFGNRLKAVKKRGKVVVIDPRRTETARKASEHIFVKPGRDVLLLLAMIQQVFENNWVKLRHLEEIIEAKQVETLKTLTQSYTPEKVADKVGISAEKIKTLIQEFCAAESAVCYGRMGVSTVEYGGMSLWLVYCLNIITGNFDHPGGFMLPTPAFDTIRSKTQKPRFGRWKSRVRNLPEFYGELPAATMAEEILTEGEGQIKAMMFGAGNPVLSTPNGKQLDKAYESLEYAVAIDIYLNETTRHANIILPPATGIETAHYDVVFTGLSVRNNAKYSPALFPKSEDAKYDWEIYLELQKRMETQLPKDHPKYKIQQGYYQLTPEIMLDMGLRNSSYQLSLEEVAKHPHGMDLGALKTQLPNRLLTTNKRLNLVPDFFIGDFERLNAQFFASQNDDLYQFLLIGRRHLRSNNSWMHNSKRLVKGRNRCTLLIHPEDAKTKGIISGTAVKVQSRVGEVSIEAEVSDEIMQGVVSIPHGWGHSRKGIQLDIAQAHAGVSANDITDEKLVDQLTGNIAFNGVPVNVFLN